MARMYCRLLQCLVALLCVISARAESKWFVEAEEGGHVVWSGDTLADIHAPKGLTLWNKALMEGNVTIEYEARVVSDGRLSDLNCFWMASDPKAKDVFANAEQRGGKFVNSYTMRLYYMGFGGNYNSTTRFRRYDGDTRGVDDVVFRPAILREYNDSNHLLRGDHWYKIKLEAIDGHARFTIDGECIVDFADPKPLRKGYFGFRTTLAHAQLRNFRYTCKPVMQTQPVGALMLERGRKHTVETIPLNDVTGACDPISGLCRTRGEGITFGVPFAMGELEADEPLTLKSGDRTLATDQWTLASWPDGSVKWKAIATVQGSDVACGGNTDEVVLHPSSCGMLFDSITIGGRAVVGRGWVECNGKTLAAKSIAKEREGRVRTCWRMEGDNFIVRIYKYKGSDELKIVHTLLVDSAMNKDGLKSLSLRFEVPMSGAAHSRRVLFMGDSAKVRVMDVKPLIARRPIHLDGDGVPADAMSRSILEQIASWNSFRLSQLSPNGFSIRKRTTSVSPWIGTIEGHRAPGLVAVGDKTKGVAFHLTDFWQSYPSTLEVDDARKDTSVVSLHLWSAEAEAMSFAHYDTIPHGLEASYEDVQPGMSTADGIARTSTIYITLTAQPIDSMAGRLPSLAHHSQYVALPEYLHAKRAFGIWSLDRGTRLDTVINNVTDFYAAEQERNGWYGFFNYGDVMHAYDTSRGEWRYDVGGFAWDNTELASPAMFWYEFLRTGDPLTWRMAVAMCRHNGEVDCYHRGVHAGLGSRHNVVHWGCGAKEARISEAFWNRFLYYLTADERTGDLLDEVADADQLLYHLDPMRLAQPRSPEFPCTAPARLRVGPDWLAYAGNWFTRWERTGNTAYRDKVLAGMRSIAALPHGLFSGPKALGYDPATGIVSWEGDSAVQNTNHLLCIMGGFEMMNEMMLSLTTPEWNKAWLHHAEEYREKATELSHSHFWIPRLQAYAYWLTGKRKYFDEAVMQLRIGNRVTSTNEAATFTLDAIFMQEVMDFDYNPAINSSMY